MAELSAVRHLILNSGAEQTIVLAEWNVVVRIDVGVKVLMLARSKHPIAVSDAHAIVHTRALFENRNKK